MPYSYLYHDRLITLSPSEDCFAVKLVDDTKQLGVESALQNVGMSVSRSIVAPSNEILYLVHSATNGEDRIRVLENVPGIIRATPTFKNPGSKELVLLNRIVIKFKPGVSDVQIADLLRISHFTLEREDEFERVERRLILRQSWYSREDVFKQAYDLSLLPIVKYATPDILALNGLSADVAPDDPYYSNQWNLDKINVEGAWHVTMGSSSIKIAVLHNGVD